MNADLSHFSIGGQDLANPNADFSNLGNKPDKRMQMLIGMLRSGKKDNGATEYVDGWAVPKAPTEGLSNMLGGVASAYAGRGMFGGM